MCFLCPHTELPHVTGHAKTLQAHSCTFTCAVTLYKVCTCVTTCMCNAVTRGSLFMASTDYSVWRNLITFPNIAILL